MKFCIRCNKPLEFLEFLDGDQCADCRRTVTAATPQNSEPEINIDEMLETIVTLSGNKMELRSKEGWVLWSGGPGSRHSLKSVLVNAQRILAIRRKRSNTRKP